jgi:hypothetical protein
MLWSLVEVIFVMIATYINQLELSRLFIEKYTAEKQDQQLRDYLKNGKDGIIVFKQLDLKESKSLKNTKDV